MRPERIAFASAGVPGTLKACVFQGKHWLCHVETPSGTVVVTHPNDGREVPREGTLIAKWRFIGPRASGGHSGR